MKITKSQLKKLIKEELANVLQERVRPPAGSQEERARRAQAAMGRMFTDAEEEEKREREIARARRARRSAERQGATTAPKERAPRRPEPVPDPAQEPDPFDQLETAIEKKPDHQSALLKMACDPKRSDIRKDFAAKAARGEKDVLMLMNQSKKACPDVWTAEGHKV